MYELISTIITYAIPVTFLISPIIALICGFVRVSRYNDAKLQRVMKPESYTDEDMKDFKKSIISAFITALVLTIIVIATILLFYEAMTHM